MSEATKCMAMAPYEKIYVNVSNINKRSVEYEEPTKRKESAHTSSSNFCEVLYEDSSFFRLLKSEGVPTLEALVKRHGYTYTELVKAMNESWGYEHTTVEELIKITTGTHPLCATYVVKLCKIFNMPAVEILKSAAMTQFEEGIFPDEYILDEFISDCQHVMDWQKKKFAYEEELFEAVTKDQEDSFYKLLKDEQVPTLEALIERHEYTYTELAKAINESLGSESATVEDLIKITAGKLPLFATYVVELSKIFNIPAVEILKSGAMTEFEAGIFSGEQIFESFMSSCHHVMDWQNEKIKMQKEFLEDDKKNQKILIQDLKKAENRVSFFRLCTLLCAGFSLLLMILRFI